MEHRCHVDRQACEVVSAMMTRFRPPIRRGRSLELALVREIVVTALPCASCREVEHAAERIARVRLGRHERNILLHAPPADSAEGAILDPSLKTHSDRETYLRAVRKLGRAGLIRIGRRRVAMQTSGRRLDGSPVQRVYAHRTLWLTPFGRGVIDCYRRELEEGRPIRWALYTDRAMASARLTGADLLARFEQSLSAAAGAALREGTPAIAGVDAPELHAVLNRAVEAVRARVRLVQA